MVSDGAHPISMTDMSFKLLPTSDDELLVASFLCFAAGFLLCFFAYRAPQSVSSTIGGLLFGAFCLNEIVPQFGHDGFLCYLVGAWVSLIGAMVGTTVTLLATWASVGTCLGCLAGTFLVLADGGALLQSQATVSVLFALLIAACLCLSWFQEKSCTIMMMASTGGLLMAFGVDLTLDGRMVVGTEHILQMIWDVGPHCWEECHMLQLLLLWGSATVVGVLVQGHMSGILPLNILLQKVGLWRARSVYNTVEGQDGGDWSGGSSAGSGFLERAKEKQTGVGGNRYTAGMRKTWTYSNNDTWNYFDTENLPRAMDIHKDSIFVAADNVANEFGFQDDNVRNQVEHAVTLLANHRRFANEMAEMTLGEASLPPKSSIHSLHRKLFINYKDWCEAMRVRPYFHPPAESPSNDRTGLVDKNEEDALAVDIMLWLCLWGEAGNLRHMPECLCFLFHKMMQEAVMYADHDTPTLYAGYFLDHVVTPIYEVVTRGKKGRDHLATLNYDDYNEFFWTPSCLRYSYREGEAIDGTAAVEDGRTNSGTFTAPGAGDNVLPVWKGMAAAPKTFLEKRSILSTVLCFHRVVEFHVITFQILAVLSFSAMMVWSKAYCLQMLSTVFWSINFLGILWTSLEVWQAFPGIQITGTAKCGFLVRLCLRFLILVYQSMYFMWSTQHDDNTMASTKDGLSVMGMQAQGDYVFWWWQYLWLSFFAMIPYVTEMWQQIFPPIATWLCNCNNDYLQALLNICYPLSRVYVGKRVDVSVGVAMRYIFFWSTLLAWKLYFSYKYEVLILVLPSVELYDDYVNYPETSYWGMFFLILLRWLPQMFIFFIDSSIWFACWSAMAGTVVGFQKRLGEIRDFPSIRTHFMKIPERFCSTVICPGAASRDTSMADMAGQAPAVPVHSILNEASNLLNKQAPAEDDNGHRVSTRARLAEFLEIRTPKWAIFAAVWNEVINKMRLSDVISNAEKNILKFHLFEGFAKPVYLPIFQTAGSVDVAVNMIQEHVSLFESEEDPSRRGQHEAALRRKIQEDVTVNEALSEVWELGSWFLRILLGHVHSQDMERTIKVFEDYMNSSNAMYQLKLRNIKTITADVTAIIITLHHALPKRKPSGGSSQPKASGVGRSTTGTGKVAGRSRSGGGMTKSISTTSLSSIGSGAGALENGTSSVVSSGLATAGRRQGMVGAHSTSTTSAADKTRDAVRDKLRPLFHDLRNMLTSADEKGTEIQGRLSYIMGMAGGFMWDDAYASSRLDALAEDKDCMMILEKLHGLLGVDRRAAEPSSVEARRRLAFFTNSLFMDIPRAPAVGDMMSWTCMTPFYSEDVVYSRADLEQKNDDGLTTIMYLQALYKSDWRNYMERTGIAGEQQAMSKTHLEDTRLWASFRAQTLARTVEGIMYYESALRLLANCEGIKDPKQNHDIVLQKFQYVVACQVYGRMKKNQDPKADDIEFLLRRFSSLRVAYIDEVRVSTRGEANTDRNSSNLEYFSVLIKAGDGGEIQEVYRVKLPGNPVFGEGKPENQNHAMMFTRGEHIQAIDMNQEGYFEEAIKMRSLLEEFRRGTPRRPTVIVGFREHIFTGSVSSLANYMALQELSFVTLGQRVLNNPLRVRMHYGHPDLFDKIFYMTAGGISKASKGINLSEDIFAGYNGTIRGGKVHFSEYIQVGKGRDVGMQQIYKFEAKLSQGAAEQTLSRDVNRLGDRLDFFRLMSFYFGGLGYYVGNFITVLTVTFVVYFILALAVFDAESIGDRKLIPEGNLQMMLAGMGLLNTMPMLATIMVEKGLLASLGEVLQVFLSGGPMYFMFHIQTRAHYFYQTLLAGGAQYRATGRGFVTHHSCFDDLYRFFANSHFYLGFELMTALIVTAAMTSSKQYFGMTWSLWLACLSFLFAPFWFNPLSFHWGKVVQDYKMWITWMTGTGGSSSNSWEVWWREENSYVTRFTLTQKLQMMVRPLIYVVIGYGIGGPKLLGLDHNEIKVVMKLFGQGLALIGAYFITQCYGTTFSPWLRRSATILITSFAVVYGVFLLLAHTKYISVAIGLYYIGAALSIVGLLAGYRFAKYTWHMHDFIIGHLLFVILFLLAALQFPSTIQTWLLFHNALSEGVVIDDILKYARMNKELADRDEDPMRVNADMRRILQAQAAELEMLKQQIIASGGGQLIGVQGGGNNAMPVGSLNASPTGGLSFMYTPLAGSADSDSSARPPQNQEAEMMHASNSTLDLAELAHARPGDASNCPQSKAFQFSSPMSIPPR